MKKIFVLIFSVFIMMGVSFGTTVFAEEFPVDPAQIENVDPEPDPEPVTEPETEAPETEPVTEAPETEPVTEAPETEPVTEAPATEPETEAPVTEPATEYQEDVEPETYDVNKLPTLVDSTQVAEDLPTAIGADSNSGGVSKLGGIVCWIGVGIAISVILACLISTRGKNKAGVGRFDSGNKYASSNYGGRYR